MDKLSTKRREKAEALLETSRIAQAEFWRSLSELEACLGIEIESAIDLKSVNIEDLLDPVTRRAILGYQGSSPFPFI